MSESNLTKMVEVPPLHKPAIINNDLKILVPPFIEADDEIVIDTRTMEYVKKIK